MLVISASLAYSIGTLNYNWKKDMYTYIIYDSISNIALLGAIGTWCVLFLNVNYYYEEVFLLKIIKYVSTILFAFNSIIKISLLPMSYEDYFRLVDINKLIA